MSPSTLSAGAQAGDAADAVGAVRWRVAVSAEQWGVLAAAAALAGVGVAEYVRLAVAARVRQDLWGPAGAEPDAVEAVGVQACETESGGLDEPVTALVSAAAQCSASDIGGAGGLVRRELVCADEAAAHGRALLRGAWLDWGAVALAGEGMLMVSELVTNAVVHGEKGAVSLWLATGRRYGGCGGGEVVCGVVDASAEPPRPHRAGPDEEGGRGLALVAALADACGWSRAGTGKMVWFSQHLGRAGHEDRVHRSHDGHQGSTLGGGDGFPVTARSPHPLLRGVVR